jgi:hypothetical protein
MTKYFLRFVIAFLRVQWARFRGYEVLAEFDEVGVRWLHCSNCTEFNGAQCGACGCLVEAKTIIAVESCPLGYWKAIWRKKVDRDGKRRDS